MTNETRVPNKDWYTVTPTGEVYSYSTGYKRQLKPEIMKKGYLRVKLYDIGGETYQKVLIHRLVAAAYIGNPPSPKHMINHIDGNPSNNNVNNLEWVTSSENVQHAYDTKLIDIRNKSGEKHPMAKLSREEVEAIKRIANTGLVKQATIAAWFGVGRRTVQNIKYGKSWKYAG